MIFGTGSAVMSLSGTSSVYEYDDKSLVQSEPLSH